MVGGASVDNLTYLRKYGGPSDFAFVMSNFACGNTQWQTWHWGPPGRLKNGRWYRFEYAMHWVNSTHVQVRPRIYDDANTLLYTEDAFLQGEPFDRPVMWNGQSWTLAQYYAAGYSFCVDPSLMGSVAMGNNGQAQAVSTGLHWYFGAVQIRSDTWPGP